MDLTSIYQFVIGIFPSIIPVLQVILVILGSLVVLASTYVKLTPTQDDDAWFAKVEAVPVLGDVIKFLLKFSAISRKDV